MARLQQLADEGGISYSASECSRNASVTPVGLVIIASRAVFEVGPVPEQKSGRAGAAWRVPVVMVQCPYATPPGDDRGRPCY